MCSDTVALDPNFWNLRGCSQPASRFRVCGSLPARKNTGLSVPFFAALSNVERIATNRFKVPDNLVLLNFYGAQERTRTSTTLRPLDPESSASASSATWAQVR